MGTESLELCWEFEDHLVSVFLFQKAQGQVVPVWYVNVSFYILMERSNSTIVL